MHALERQLEGESQPCGRNTCLVKFNVKKDVAFQETSISFFSQNNDALDGNLDSVSLNAVSSTIMIREKESHVLRIPPDTQTIGMEAFQGCVFDTAYLDDGRLASIESRAFAECPNLRKVFISETTAFIADDAFEGVEDLTIYGVKNSYAESFAKRLGILFEEYEGQ